MMYKLIKIYDWYPVLYPYLHTCASPEIGQLSLWGAAEGHPRFEDGTRILTSNIVAFDADKMEVKTCSGSHYKLMGPDKKFMEWLEEKGLSLKDYNR